MSKILNYSLLFLLVFSCDLYFAQVISPDNIGSLKVNELGKKEIQKIKDEMDKQGVSLGALEEIAIANGMSALDFETLKGKIEFIEPEVLESNLEAGSGVKEKITEFDQGALNANKIFGASVFTNASLSFEPNSNMVTPSSYILGPGDELQLVIYGMQETSNLLQVTKEGKIIIPIVGQVFVNGLSFEAAKIQIKKACSKVYGSLSSGQSQMSLSLTKIKTIRITIIGAKKPGNYSVSSLSTVFNALHIAGGPDDNGSYRAIELIRDNKVVKKIDIYKFLMKGDQSDNLNLQENDVIRVPVYENRVTITGNIKRPGVFELLPNESFNDLLNYCGGFDEAAYRKNIKLVQNSDSGLKILDLSEDTYKSYIPSIGDVFKVAPLLNKFTNKVTIKGSVFRPDDYEFKEGMTVLDLIKKADDLTPDAFSARALLIREKVDLTKELITININEVISGAKKIDLKKNDELIISSIFDFKNNKVVSISGQIKKPGQYPYLENLTLYDLVMQAGGFLEGSSKVIEISSVIIKDEAVADQKENAVVRTIEIDTLLLDQSKNIILSPHDDIQIRSKPVFEIQENVQLYGPVMYPGGYTIVNKNERFISFIERSGGLRTDANKNAISIFRNGKMIPINYKKAIRNKESSSNIIMKPGDKIVVKKLESTIAVSGQVYLNSEVPYVSGKRLKYYVNSVGGTVTNADKKRIYLVKANGLAKSTKAFLFFKLYPKVEPGAQVFVPEKVQKIRNNKLTTVELVVISSSLATMGSAVIAIINLTK
jgi:protein involved in polysaccharide export with SLBB domain